MVEKSVPLLRKTLAGAALAVVLLTSCSSGNENKAASTTAAPASTAATGPTTTLRPVNTSFTGQNSAQFCALAKTYNERSNSLGSNPTAAQLRSAVTDGRTAITQAVNTAPAEIKPDVQVLANTFTNLANELDKVNYEVTRLPPAALQSLQSPEFTASTTRFQAYIKQVCGIG